MKDVCLLAFDLGTTSLKGTMIDGHGKVLATASKAYETYHSGAVVEQDPDSWWKCVIDVSKQLRDQNQNAFVSVDAIGTCGHMSGCAPVDAKGNALMRALTHADSRAMTQLERIVALVDRDELYRKTGCVPDAKNALCKQLWIRENMPELYEKTAYFLQSKDYINACLTGDPNCTDYSDASHGMVLDIHTKQYLRDEMAELGLDATKLPRLYKGTDIIGRLSRESAELLGLKQGIPVVAGGGDGACASVGAGIVNSGDVYCSLGTTAWITYISDSPFIDENKRIFDIMSLDGEGFGVFGTMQTAGKAFEWAGKLFDIENPDEQNRIAMLAPAGCNGLIFLPYLEGERSPVFDSKARAVFFGANVEHRKCHFLRSALEGTAYALRSILEVFRERQTVESMRVIGGGIKSPNWLQIIADVSGIALDLPGDTCANQTSLGAAFAAGVGIGAFKNLSEASAIVRTGDRINADPTQRAIYDAGFDKYMRLYPHIKDLF